MTSSGPAQRPRVAMRSVLQDGLFAGLLGAIAVIVVFYSLIFEGPEAAAHAQANAAHAAAYNMIHVLAWIAAGVVVAWLAAVTEAYPMVWYLAFVAVSFAFFAFLWVTGAFAVPGLGHNHLWVGALVGGGVMLGYLLRRHPGIAKHLDDVYQDRPAP
jgi:hypothetical protein